MAFQGEDIYINTTTADGINHAMFISNATTPFALKIALQGFWFTKTCERMLLNILKQGGVSFTMKPVIGGTFTMGATPEQGSDAYSNELPAHQVTLSDYYIGETAVTQELWQAVMGSNPSHFKGTNLPVEFVSWNDCQEFIRRLNAQTGQKFRLPTEAEWEYAARGGRNSKGYTYSGSNNINDVAWYISNSSNKTHTVKTMLPNELGIYDMSGNVCEWCQDIYDAYKSIAQTNPIGPTSGSCRVTRGGSWYLSTGFCYVSARHISSPGRCSDIIGLRLAL